MTICIYKDDALYADGRCTAAGLIVTDSFKKIGIIYENLDDGTRTVKPKDALDNYSVYAMYAFAGEVNQLGKFLRWVCTATHPMVDIEYDDDIFDSVVTIDSEEVGLQAILVFNDEDIVRVYSADYEEHLYVDYDKSDFVAIGSGSHIALTLNKHDSKLTASQIIDSVVKTSITCGGDIRTLSLNTPVVEKTIEKPTTEKVKHKRWFSFK